ncbi:hypothetical protein PG985_007365 [Apiospora marii]|uniref:Uncharacterized protein n=1 Tax=Apiospora marii TaxID=335849 RepID=A0ABR1SQ56_9PEZI
MAPETVSCEAYEGNSLMVFQDLPLDFDPSTQWLDGDSPQHPHFNEAERIQDLVGAIKGDLLDCIFEGCRILLQRHDAQNLLQTFEHDTQVWRAAVSMHKFGVVYLGSRTDCRYDFLPVLESNEELFAAVDSFLCSERNAIRVINYGVHRWITTKNSKVERPGMLVPAYAISSIDLHHIAVRSQDVEGDSVSLLGASEALWDLHDFAHHVAAALSPVLYGSKYFSHLIDLPPRLTALIRSRAMNTAKPKPLCSDGVIFSELLTPLFEDEVGGAVIIAGGRQQETQHTYASLTNRLAESLADYLLQRRALRHGTTGALLMMEDPITPEQLAVLVQNKAYELTASEIEQRVMTRGGPADDERDVLEAMGGAADRIRYLAASRGWMYFEVRNTIKHRAQKLAYQIVAERMLDGSEGEMDEVDRELVQLVINSCGYVGWERGEVPNLWEVLLDRETI